MKLSVAIVGGGISGLTAAFYINKFVPHFIDKLYLFEKGAHFGGQIRSTRYPDGTIYEHGPRSVRTSGFNGLATLQLVDELGLTKHVLSIQQGHPSTKNRLILFNDKLYPLPTGIWSLFRTNPPFSRPLGLAVLQDVLTEKIMVDDDSMYNFACRRFGLEIADYAIDPLCRGVVAGDAREISVKTILKPLFEAEQRHGSIVKGIMSDFFDTLSIRNYKGNTTTTTFSSKLSQRAKRENWKMWTLGQGLQMLPDSLVNVLKGAGVMLHLNSQCDKIKFLEDKIELFSNGKITKVDHIFAGLPAKQLSTLLKEDHPALAKALGEINSVSVGMVNLEYPGHLLSQKAFGFLVPSNQKCDILGTIFDSCNFPQLDGKSGPKTRLTVMMGGRWFESLFGSPLKADHEMLLNSASQTMHNRLRMPVQPSRHQVLVLPDCIPQYTVGHTHRLKFIRDYLNSNGLPLTLIGASYDGVGVNDCIYHARQAIREWADLMEKALGELPTSVQKTEHQEQLGL